MADLQHTFGQDLTQAPNGDLAVSTGTQYGQERVLRRLLTNPGAYIWEPNYGGGLGAMVGQPESAAVIAGVAQGQMILETVVAQNPPPKVGVTSDNAGTVVANIAYVDAETGAPVTLSAPLGAT